MSHSNVQCCRVTIMWGVLYFGGVVFLNIIPCYLVIPLGHSSSRPRDGRSCRADNGGTETSQIFGKGSKEFYLALHAIFNVLTL